MAPKGRRGRNGRRRGRSGGEHVTFPLAYTMKEGEVRQTTVQTLLETFDRARPFRISALWGKLSSYGSQSVLFQWELFGPVSTQANTWTSGMRLAVPNGTNFRYRIPVTKTGWYPAETAVSTALMNLKAICIHKVAPSSGITGYANVRIELQPREIDNSCPTLMLPPLGDASGSPSVSVIEESDDEYFST